MNWSQDSIKMLGLTATEIRILDVLTEEKNIRDITSESGVSRTGVNYAVGKLVAKGLASPIRIKRRTNYIALSGDKLAQKFERAIGDIHLSAKEKRGVRIRTSKENEFIIHVGTDEVIPAYLRIVKENKNQRIKAIQHHRSWNAMLEKISQAQLIEFNTTVIRNKLIIDGILNESAYKQYQEEIKADYMKNAAAVESLEGRMADYTTFPDQFFDHDAEIWLFKDTALIINWREEVAIEITNKEIMLFLRDMFEFVKVSNRKIDHNRLIKQVRGTSK
jgi:DNA-binding MarR family transcriptional regulator